MVEEINGPVLPEALGIGRRSYARSRGQREIARGRVDITRTECTDTTHTGCTHIHSRGGASTAQEGNRYDINGRGAAGGKRLEYAFHIIVFAMI